MEITEVRIKLMEDSDDRLQAFCSITFDNAFVIRDLKIIDGANGPFVAMPSRKLTAHCPHCYCKNHLRAAYCNQCGRKLREERAPRDADGRAKLYADVAHPINPQCREMIQARVIAEFQAELQRAAEPGYVSRYDEDYDLDQGPELDESESGPRATARPAASHPRPPVLPPPPSEVARGVAGPRSARPESSRPESSRAEESAGPSESPSVPGEERAGAPQGPHRPVASDRSVAPPRPKSARGEFGAGIFEET